MENRESSPGKSGSFLEAKVGPLLYISVTVIGLWFLLWFANYKGEF